MSGKPNPSDLSLSTVDNSSRASDAAVSPQEAGDISHDNNNNNNNETTAPMTFEERKQQAYLKQLNAYRFFTPPMILAIFTLINFFTYYDRGAIAPAVKYIAVDETIAGNSTLSEAESGALYSVFMVGYFVTNPLFVGLGGTLTSKTIIIIGIACWCVAVVMAAIAPSYAMLMLARGIAGIGEAAYAGFTVTIIDNICPKEKRTVYISILYSMIPCGQAAGIAINGVIVTKHFGAIEGWRAGFVLEMLPMLILVVLMLLMPRNYNVRPEDRDDPVPPGFALAEQEQQTRNNQNQNQINDGGDEQEQENEVEDEEDRKVSHVPIHHALKHLFCNFNFLLLALGYAAYTFVLGAISFFAISMLTQSTMDVSTIDASLLLGGSTAILGLGASVVGGVLVDRWGGSKGYQGVYRCALFMAVCILISVPSGFVALLMSHFVPFAIIFVVTVWFLFLVTAPINCCLLTVVPANMRPYSVALSIFIMHALGDFPSAPLTGIIADGFDDGCHDFSHSQSECVGHNTTSGSCKYVPPPGPKENARCVNVLELTMALRIVWTFMSLAVPLWGAVAYRVKKHRSTTGIPADVEYVSLLGGENDGEA